MDKDIITIDVSKLDLSDLSLDIGTYTTGIYDTDTITIGNVNTDYNIMGDWFEDNRIVAEYREERALREQNEGIQKAWEQYKILVELAKNPPEEN